MGRGKSAADENKQKKMNKRKCLIFLFNNCINPNHILEVRNNK
jgi:hypothetical protein